ERDPEIEGVFSVIGQGAAGSAPNQALMYASLKPFEERKGESHSAATVIRRLRSSLSAISGAVVVPFNPPAVFGLGQFGGFTFELEDLGRNSLETIAETANKLAAQGNAGKDLLGLFSSFTANDPQYIVQINREKAKSLLVPFSQITDALQVYMGSVYVNDFDFNNRSYRVYVQADSKFRSQPKDIREYYLRSDTGKMICGLFYGHQVVERNHLSRVGAQIILTDILWLRAVFTVGLHVDAVRAVIEIEIVHVDRAHVDLQSVRNLVERHHQALCFFAVDAHQVLR